MKTVRRRTTASPDEVWSILADGWLFGSWVVGASRVRAVEPSWPQQGSRIHHSVGGWPVVIDDDTQVLESEEDRLLVMQARLRPLGQARVEIRLTPQGSGTLIAMSEDFVSGPGLLVPGPARRAALGVRNAETLHRLALMAERRTEPEG